MQKLIILLFVMVLLITSCNANSSDAIGNVFSAGESGKIKQMSTDILTCITENDKESFKQLFCEETQNGPDFAEQVDRAFEYCKGTVYFTDSTIKTTASGGEKRENGKRTYWNVDPDIPFFKVLTETDTGDEEFRYYSIRYRWNIIDEEDKSWEGLVYLEIKLLNVDSVMIGK